MYSKFSHTITSPISSWWKLSLYSINLTLFQCQSPVIIGFYKAFFNENRIYICTEFMDGEENSFTIIWFEINYSFTFFFILKISYPYSLLNLFVIIHKSHFYLEEFYIKMFNRKVFFLLKLHLSYSIPSWISQRKLKHTTCIRLKIIFQYDFTLNSIFL